jgi:hypothetical protein
MTVNENNSKSKKTKIIVQMFVKIILHIVHP